MWLKRLTPQNIVIGGAAGALPPIVGCAAASGGVSPGTASGCSRIIFMWTPPHFWALALVKARDYERVGVPMMPNVKGAGPHAAGNPGLFAAAGAARPRPVVHRRRRRLYGVAAALRSALGLCAHAVRVYLVRDGAEANKHAMALFGFSILYLFALFGAAGRRARLRPARAVGPVSAVAASPRRSR